MNFIQYLEQQKEIQRNMSKLRGDFTHGIIKEETYNTKMCTLLKKSYQLDLKYGKEIGLNLEQ